MAKRETVNTKKHIQECAIQLFKEHGYDNVTILQICEKASVTKRTFYYHFSSKDEIIFGYTAYLGEKAEILAEAMADHKSHVERLWVLMNVYSTYQSDYGVNILRQIYVCIAQGKSEEEKEYPNSTYLYDTIVQTLAAAQLAGEIKNTSDPKTLASTLQYLFRGVLFSWAASDGAFNLSKKFRVVFESLLGVTEKNSSQSNLPNG